MDRKTGFFSFKTAGTTGTVELISDLVELETDGNDSNFSDSFLGQPISVELDVVELDEVELDEDELDAVDVDSDSSSLDDKYSSGCLGFLLKYAASPVSGRVRFFI